MNRLFAGPAEKGYSLIEVLVSMLVISLGMLGMAALQITALKQNNHAYVRSQVLITAQDIVDRMRANSDAAENGDYFGTSARVDAADTRCEGEACTPAELAAYDLNNWKFKLQAEVTGGGGCVTRHVERQKGVKVEAIDDLADLCTQSNDLTKPVVVYVWWNDAVYKTESGLADDEIQVISLSAKI